MAVDDLQVLEAAWRLRFICASARLVIIACYLLGPSFFCHEQKVASENIEYQKRIETMATSNGRV